MPVRAPLVLLVLVGLPQAVAGQTLTGRVVDEARGSPVPQARVSIVDTTGAFVREALSDSLGRFRIALPLGRTFTVFTEALGYRSTESPRFVMHDTSVVRADVELTPEPIGLEPLTVAADAVTEEEVTRWLRLRMGVSPASLGGKVLAGSELAALKRPGRDLVDLLRWANLPGAYVSRATGTGGPCVMARGISCAPVMLDGMRMQPEHVADIPLEQIGAIVFLKSMDAGSLFPGRGRRSSSGRIEIYSVGNVPWRVGR